MKFSGEWRRVFIRLIRRFYPEGIPWPFSRLYARLVGIRLFEETHAHFLSRLAKTAKKRARVLDIGTGPGRLPLALARKRRDLQITGMDISPDMVAIARESALKGGEHVKFLQGSASVLPFSSSSFDLVFSTLSLHHWREPEKAFTEIRRVLRKGGKAVIWDVAADAPHSAYDRLRIRYGWLRTLFFRLHGFTEPFYSRKEVAGLARGAGFSNVSVRPDGVFFRLEASK